MAEKLSSYQFRRGGTPKYPWGEWTKLNGKGQGPIMRCVQGEDFTTTVDGFRAAIAAHAKSAGLKYRTATEDDDAVVFQFFKETT